MAPNYLQYEIDGKLSTTLPRDIGPFRAAPGAKKLPFKVITVQPHVPRIYKFFATGLGASMWFFLMYRAKKDGPALLGWKHPWDH